MHARDKKMEVNIKCLVDISEYKIPVIKALRANLGVSLKEGKDLADLFHHQSMLTYESNNRVSIVQANATARKTDGTPLLEFSHGANHANNGFNTEDFLEKIKFFVGLALENDEPILAEDLLHVYNKHTQENNC